MNISQKIAKLERLRAKALQMRRELHGRRHDPFFKEEYAQYGKAVEEANKAIFELDSQLEIERI